MPEKVWTPILVGITIALVLVANAIFGGTGKAVEVYRTDSPAEVAWRKDTVPPDRWIGVILDQEGWRRLPAEVGLGDRLTLAGEEPDFDRQVAVVAYMGAQRTGGYSIDISRVTYAPGDEDEKGRLTIQLEAASPVPGDFVTQAFTNPVGYVTIERQKWPQGAVKHLATGQVITSALDQDGNDWGPVHILQGADGESP